MDYDLRRLGTREFEHLTQALALKVFGPAVKVFGDGPDGGREATFHGRVNYPDPAETGPWQGYGVLQAKFRARPTTTQQDTSWLLGQIRAEMKAWEKKNSRRRKQGLPDYLLFTTNVYLSSTPESGGIDQTNYVIADHADELGLKGWDVWGGDQINRYLDAFADIRLAFAAFVTPGDVLAKLVDVLQGNVVDLSESLAIHAAHELGASRWVRLNQAGSPASEKLALAEVGVDLPATNEDGAEVPRLINHLIALGDQVLRPSSLGARPRHVVLVGGPGQGKTTLTQLLCQAYRVALLRDRPVYTLGAAGPVLTDTRDRLATLGIEEPTFRRWPLAIKLSEFGDAVAGGADLDLLRFIAQRFGARAGTDVGPSLLRSWLRNWPWLLVLDGLDEVAHPAAREHVDQRVQEFLTDAAMVDADLLVVATTRPQGYNAEFDPEFYDHYSLRYLTSEEALGYGRELARVRHDDDPDHEAVVIQRLSQAAADPNTAHLIRTPLQVTIMSLLLEQRAGVPPTRFRLFDSTTTPSTGGKSRSPALTARCSMNGRMTSTRSMSASACCCRRERNAAARPNRPCPRKSSKNSRFVAWWRKAPRPPKPEPWPTASSIPPHAVSSCWRQ